MSAVVSERRGPMRLADPITLDESVTMAFLAVLEAMTPGQRVAVILHDVLGYSYAEVAEITGRSPAECRQLAASARRIRDSQAPAAPSCRQAQVVGDFRRAWEARDIDALIALLHPAVTAITDSGGLVGAALGPIQGDEQIAHYLVDLADQAPGRVVFAEHTVNGRPGLVARRDGVTVALFAFDVDAARGLITRICACTRPRHAPAPVTG